MEVTERASGRGAAVVLEPREGPVGWRSILAVPSGARIALWQPKVPSTSIDRSSGSFGS
jgi:predicted enzyme related to lactoylglutathione lyase